MVLMSCRVVWRLEDTRVRVYSIGCRDAVGKVCSRGRCVVLYLEYLALWAVG